MGHHRPFTPRFFRHRAGLTPRLETEPPGSRSAVVYFPTLHRNRSRAMSFVAQWRINPRCCATSTWYLAPSA
jgi:hypothetical protein